MRPQFRRLLIFAALLTAAVIGPSLLTGIVAGRAAMIRVAAVLGLGAAMGVLLWLVWRLLQLFLFRVGRKLAFSYFLIGVLPIPMLAVLSLLNAYLLSGFFLGHLYRDAVRGLHDELARAAAVALATVRGSGGPRAEGEVAIAVYRDGVRVGADDRFPAEWPVWLQRAEADRQGVSSYASLADGTPTLAVAAGAPERGVVALYTGDLEAELSRRAEVWVRLLRADDPRRDSPIRLRLGERDFALQPLITRKSVEGREEFFGADASTGGYFDRPLLWWGEISPPLLSLADGERVGEFVTASLNGTPRTMARRLFSASAEVDTAVWALVITATGLLGSIYAIAVVMALWLIFTVSRAVNRLSRATGAVQRGDFSVRIPVRRRDQVGELQRSFNEMTENLEMLVATAAQNEILEKELEIARNLQKSLLPRDLPSSEQLDFAALFEPSAAIGGDYYDILPGADGRLAVVIADVAGHGLPAGLRMAMLKAALLMLVEESRPPDQIVRRLNAMVSASGERRFFVTATVATVDVSNATLELTNAGHPPTYLVRGGETREILLPGHPLGALGESYGRETVRLMPDDVVLWLSDGLIEATDRAGEPFGYERLSRAVAGPPASAAEVLDRLVAAVARHAGSAPAQDDKTAVAMRYRAVGASEAASPSRS